MNPVPGYDVSTPYGRRGPYWSCHQNAAGEGIHTGADYAAPAGARVVAARPGNLLHTHLGSAFGSHQLVILAHDGTRDFYAHMRTRVPPGPVAAGDTVGEVGSEGNATGPHLHFERQATHYGGWSCDVVRDPGPSIGWEDDDMTEDDWNRLRKIVSQEVEDGWEKHMTVTAPGSGTDQDKARQQVLRELWQKVTKAT